MELSGVLGEGEPESGSCASLREEPEYLRPLCFIVFLIQAEVLVIEPGSEALDLPEQIALHLPPLAEVLECGDNLFTFKTHPRGYKRTGNPRGLASVLGCRVPEALGQVGRDRIQAEHDHGTFNGVTGTAPAPSMAAAQEGQMGRVAPTSRRRNPFC
ncbi:hypothetical protein D187_004016 [Cystobacter fuscus DSM 2262]|uniref:Uncharacterized protein n=1 Tax=Cystobacter fuscus (strain ATCC 25194 / DSM 2262 / NBRC 100088 / M29) TaxID=1242864 RepID=S9QB48_CYSF2|nr:hypothetical protein D187_004016 [Cystobacter fuscus DSM 2262]